MKLLEIINTDWAYRLPTHLKMNRWRGLNRLCYQLLAILYYSLKTLVLFIAFLYYMIFKGIWLAIKWIFRLDSQAWFIRLKERFKSCNENEESDGDDYNLDSLYDTDIPVDDMSGTDFEHFCADLLRIDGYTDVWVTVGSGDHGIDIVAKKDGIKWGFQCKRWNIETHIGNDVVRDTFAGKAFYHCDIAVIITTSYFTVKAEEYAKETGVLLWGRDKLLELMGKMRDTEQSEY